MKRPQELYPYLMLSAKDLARPIETLELPRRIYRLLKRHSIDTVGELLIWSEGELLRIYSLNRGTFDQLQATLTARGLRLSQHTLDSPPPEGDKWQEVLVSILYPHRRRVLHSQMPTVALDVLIDNHGAQGTLLGLQSFGVKKVGRLLNLRGTDILAFNWPERPDSANITPWQRLDCLEAVLRDYGLHLRTGYRF